MKKLTLFTLLLIFTSGFTLLNAQATEIDSLENLLQQHLSEDTLRVNLLNKTAQKLLYLNKNKTLKYAKESKILAEKLNYPRGKANSIYWIALYSHITSDFTKALENYQESIRIYTELGEKKGVAQCLNNMGIIYKSQGDYALALEYYEKSLKIKEELEDKRGISRTLINVGVIHKQQGNCLRALENYQESLKITKEIEDKQGVAINLHNIGEIHLIQGDYPLALEYFQLSLKIKKEIENEYLICSSLSSIGSVYLKTSNYTKAFNYSIESLKIAKELDLLEFQKNAYKQLSEIYAATKNYKKAYENHLLFKELNDSIFNEKNIKKITSLELEYEYEKEKQATELIQQKKDAVSEEEIKYQKTIKNVSIAGLFVALLVILLFYRIVRIKKKANNALQQRNEEVILQKDLISEQKSEIQVQAEELLAHKENLEEIVEQRTVAFLKEKERAEESDQLKTAFLNNISHEFRTPMNGILGFSSMLIKPGLSSDNQKKYADIISKSGNQLLNIVNDTVEISKVHSEQAKVHKSIVNISSLVSETVSEFKDSALLKKIDVKLELKREKEQLLIEIDENKIERIFWHLIDNAIKFTSDGYIKIAAKKVENNQIQFQIEDTGIGISPELQEKIFDPFRQVETGATRNFGGNGIGLSLAKAYIGIMDGKIWLESEFDKGTTVFFTIPMQKSIKTETEKQIITSGDINNKTILIVEDNELNYLLIHEMLSKFSDKLFHAWNGKEAIEIFAKEKQIDLILMDLKMPVMDGYEALKKIKEISPNIPIIAQTAYASDTDKEEIKSAGFDDYITKPINEDKLVKMLKQRI
ncbi:MAG: hypothetical protein DRJ10_05180 [Bacteroidetes bacterium]|nr:MAG: hypothetical protein DRJ10_05180 [Bacteroidota bacterium]